jgi:hypothetical protein
MPLPMGGDQPGFMCKPPLTCDIGRYLEAEFAGKNYHFVCKLYTEAHPQNWCTGLQDECSEDMNYGKKEDGQISLIPPDREELPAAIA